MGTILTEPVSKTLSTNIQMLTISNAKAGSPFIYYTGAGWNKARDFSTHEQWFSYLKEFNEKQNKGLVVE